MDPLLGDELRDIHQSFLDAAKGAPDLWFVAATGCDEFPDWPERPGREPNERYRGLYLPEWREILRTNEALPLREFWLGFEGKVWRGALYNHASYLTDGSLKAQHDRLTKAASTFETFAANAARCSNLPAPRNPKWPLRPSPVDRWLEQVCQMEFIEPEDRQPFHIRRVPGDIFTASVRTLQALVRANPLLQVVVDWRSLKAGILPGLSEGFLKWLDEELVSICRLIDDGDMEHVEHAIRELCNRVTHQGTRIGSEPNKLLGRNWHDTWQFEQRAYCVPINQHNSFLDERQSDYLRQVCTQMVRFLVDGTNEHLQRRIITDVRAAIEDYLSTRDVEIAFAGRAANERGGKRKAKRKRGGQLRSDPRQDRKIREAWETGRYRRYSDLAAELQLTEIDVRHAIDRNRKR